MKNLMVILSHDWVELGKVTIICAVNELHLQLAYGDICRAVGDSYHTCMHSDVNNQVESFSQWEDRVKNVSPIINTKNFSSLIVLKFSYIQNIRLI